MPHLTPVSRVTLGEQVAAQLAGQISEGRWRPGERLPSEAELCKVLHIGRSTLREALKSLAFVGMVRMRPGEGTYVTDGSRSVVQHMLSRGLLNNEKNLGNVGETRQILETALAALAAERAEKGDLDKLAELLGEMDRRLNGEGAGKPYEVLDLEFHLAIAACSKNEILQQLLVPIQGMLHEWIVKSQELPGLRQNAQAQHAKILEAIQQRNPEKARRAMRAHLQTCENAFALLRKISETTAETARNAQDSDGDSRPAVPK